MCLDAGVGGCQEMCSGIRRQGVRRALDGELGGTLVPMKAWQVGGTACWRREAE
jgi:hypothetical protein